MKKLSVLVLLLLTPLCGMSQSNKDIITINAAGDIMMGTLFPEKRLPPQDGESLFKNVTRFLTNNDPDIVFANLEGAMTHHPTTVKNVKSGRSYAFRMPPSYVKFLKQAGFTLLNTANNHSYDFGYKGYTETRKILKENGITPVGNKNEIVTQMINGLKVSTISFYVNARHNSLNDIPGSRKIISTAATNCDILIISFHGGAEGDRALHVVPGMEKYLGESRGDLIKFSHMAIDNGADLIIGHGPHIPRAMELYKGRLIAYSLGNFVTYRMATTGYKKYTLILSATLHTDGSFLKGEITPLLMSQDWPYNGIPDFDPQYGTAKLIRKISLTDFPESKLEISTNGIMSVKE